MRLPIMDTRKLLEELENVSLVQYGEGLVEKLGAVHQ